MVGTSFLESGNDVPRALVKQSSSCTKPAPDIKPSKEEAIHWRKSPTMRVADMVAHPDKSKVENLYIAERKYLIHLESGPEKNFE